jgi:hypothetical protein
MDRRVTVVGKSLQGLSCRGDFDARLGRDSTPPEFEALTP